MHYKGNKKLKRKKNNMTEMRERVFMFTYKSEEGEESSLNDKYKSPKKKKKINSNQKFWIRPSNSESNYQTQSFRIPNSLFFVLFQVNVLG